MWVGALVRHTELREAVWVGNTEILVVRERKTKNWKKWYLELLQHNKTSHKVSLGWKSEITFLRLLRSSSSLIPSTEPNARGTSVKIGFSVDYLDFDFDDIFLTAHHCSNYGQELFPERALTNSQSAKTFFFCRATKKNFVKFSFYSKMSLINVVQDNFFYLKTAVEKLIRWNF